MIQLRRILLPVVLSATLVVPLGSSLVASHFGWGKARSAPVAAPAQSSAGMAKGLPRRAAQHLPKDPLDGADPSETMPPETMPPGGGGDPKDEDMGRGMDLLGEGTRMILRGLLSEVQPLLEDLRGKVDDLNAYHPPEVLPNGDILIRRRMAPDQLPPDGMGPDGAGPGSVGPDGEVEL